MINESFKSFEELDVWKLSRELRIKVSEISKRFPNNEKYILKSQLLRSSRSVPANIAEGFGRFHFKENIQFCRQARGSIYELIDDFIECYECKYINEEEVLRFKAEGYNVIKLLNAYISSTMKLKKELHNEV